MNTYASLRYFDRLKCIQNDLFWNEMPELPEVETVLRGLMPYLEGQKIQNVVVRCPQLRWPIPADLQLTLVHQTILKLKRRGKYLLLTMTHGTLIIHLGMSGSLRIVPRETLLRAHDHLDIVFSNDHCLRYNDPRRFGAVLWTIDDPLKHPLIKSIGIEPLDLNFTADFLYQKTLNRSCAIKSLLMNSHIISGIGNIYAAESLFKAKIYPHRPAKLLTLLQCEQLVIAIKEILQTAITKGGTTLKDFINAEGKPGYFSQNLSVYGRDGLPCNLCQTPLSLSKIGQRSTVFCRVCQGDT